MFTLATHQAATWGYSFLQHPTLNVSGLSDSSLGLFTKPILAPNGNMYAISLHEQTIVNGVTYNGVFLKITPGTSNSSTTNWSTATFLYIPADATPADDNGFGKLSWSGTNTIGVVNFNTGVLATNGLIYFPPNVLTNWVVFNPTTEKWKITNQYKPNNQTSIGTRTINCAVLGTDNKIYALGSASTKAFRITTSALAANDTIEDSHYAQFYGTSSPLGNNTTLSWKDSNNTTNTDTVTGLGGQTAAYTDAPSGGTTLRNFNKAHHVLVHPSGKIFMLQARGRGRIFYIDIANWGNDREIVSEPSYYIQNVSGSETEAFEGAYLVLEKPRDNNHDVNSLKIYIIPACTPSPPISPNSIGNQYASTKLFVIDPVLKTMSSVNMGYSKNVATSTDFRGMGARIVLPNGFAMAYNCYLGIFQINRQGGVIITGKDVPNPITTGANFITTSNKSPFYENNATVIDNKLTNLSLVSPKQSGINGSCTPSWPHNGKTIVYTSSKQIIEIVSVKGYGPDITNFNFSERDKANYQLTPSNLSTLGSTIYNSQYNNPK
jgi:hypothetical protein